MSKVKTFLQKWIVNNLGYKILAVVIAFVLWLVITNTIDPVTSRTVSNIPVEILNEESVLDGTHVYTIMSGKNATVVVSGNRSIVGSLKASDFVATADFSELSITNAVPIKVELTGEKARYASSVTISLKTNSMVISLENMAEKGLDVEVQFTGQAPEDILIEDAAASPARVTLHAPESIIDTAERAVVLVNYSEVTGDVTLKKKPIIYDSSGALIELGDDIYLDESKVAVNITTTGIKSVPVSIEALGTPADGYELSGITCSKTSISIRGDEKTLEKISELKLPSDLLNINGSRRDVSITIDLEAYLPEGVTLYGDTGTITIVATISRVEQETSSEEESETESESKSESESESESGTEDETTTG